MDSQMEQDGKTLRFTKVDDIIVKISLSPKYRVFSTISFGIALGDSTDLRCWPSISVGDSTDIWYWSRIGVGYIPTDETIAQCITSEDYNNAKIHS